MWNALDEGIAGCVCAVVGNGTSLEGYMEVHLSDADDCFVVVGSGRASFSFWNRGIFSGGGDDLMCGGDSKHKGDNGFTGDSNWHGGNGNDTMHAGGGNDGMFFGGDGDDKLYPGEAGDGSEWVAAGDNYFYGARLPPSARPRRAPAAAPSYAARATLVPQRIDADACRASRAQAAPATTLSTVGTTTTLRPGLTHPFMASRTFTTRRRPRRHDSLSLDAARSASRRATHAHRPSVVKCDYDHRTGDRS